MDVEQWMETEREIQDKKRKIIQSELAFNYITMEKLRARDRELKVSIHFKWKKETTTNIQNATE